MDLKIVERKSLADKSARDRAQTRPSEAKKERDRESIMEMTHGHNLFRIKRLNGDEGGRHGLSGPGCNKLK